MFFFFFNNIDINEFIQNDNFKSEICAQMGLSTSEGLILEIDETETYETDDVVTVTINATRGMERFVFIVDFYSNNNTYKIISSNDLNIDEIQKGKTKFDVSYWSYNITYDQLAKMFEKKKIKVPEMQRGFVWNQNQASRLIESIVMGLPLPSIFLVAIEENSTKEYLVIDGLQRITSIHAFKYNRPLPGSKLAGFALKGVNQIFEGKTFKDLEDEGLSDNLEYNTINVIEFNQTRPYSESAMFSIFERLNSGGTTLTDQQIRNSIFYGYFNKKLNDFSEKHMKTYFPKNQILNLRHSELVLRAISINQLYSEIKEEKVSRAGTVAYKSLMNDIAENYHVNYKKSNLLGTGSEFELEIDSLFDNIRDGINEIGYSLKDSAYKKYDLLNNKFTGRISPILFEASLVAVLQNRDKDIVREGIENRYKELFTVMEGDKLSDFDKYFTQGTGQKENIVQRVVCMERVLYNA
ncbi:DUF262 domain-containing protein [Streptococcus suis]|uniref:DUF262 domain-containing protein n=1 Tax=Streptococcus suis TaxID=1307 RepID=UPI0023D7FDF3|nr:DUF262 domain-containing protein [Streptococcus suis]